MENDENEKILEEYLNLFPIYKYINSINIQINKKTLFDFSDNIVYVDSSGILGFYIPNYSHGYYELQ